MKVDNEKYELIERYQNLELSEEELLAFEKKLAEDKTFEEEVESHRAIHELVVNGGLLELKEKMIAFDKSYSYRGSKNKYFISAGAVVLLSLSTLLYFKEFGQKEVTKPQVSLKKDTITEISPVEKTVTRNNKVITHNRREKTKANNSAIKEGPISEDTVTNRPKIEDLSPIKVSPIEKNVSTSAKVTKEPVPSIPAPSESKEVEECTLKNFNPKVSTIQTCASQATGIIFIDKNSIKEGVPPFKFFIEENNYISGYEIKELPEGTYYLSVIDAKGCKGTSSEEIIIKEKDCSEIHEYSLAPETGNNWKLPIDRNTNGKIEIFNRNGVLVYSSFIKNGFPEEWNGAANNGTPLPMGSYTFVIKSGKEVVQGAVTIIR